MMQTAEDWDGDDVADPLDNSLQRCIPRSAGLIRAGGTLVSIVGPTEARPADGLAVDFVVESDRAQLSEIVQRVRDGRLRTNIGSVSALDDAVATFNATEPRGEDGYPRSSVSDTYRSERGRLSRHLWLYSWHSEL